MMYTQQVPLLRVRLSSLNPSRLLPGLQSARLLSFDTSHIRRDTASCIEN